MPSNPDLWYPSDKLFIDGSWHSPATGQTLTLENPSSGQPLTDIARGGKADIDQAVAAARQALAGPDASFRAWPPDDESGVAGQ
jgi:aldehyde dehydrogenase (NAD+)